MIKKILKIFAAIIVLAILFALGFFWYDANSEKYDTDTGTTAVPIFSEIRLDYAHIYNKEQSLPIAPSALIDIDKDGVEEIFFGGGFDQEDKLYAYRNGEFINITKEINFPSKNTPGTTTGVATADFDDNGFNDIILGREDGLHIYYNNNGTFTHTPITTPINDISTPAGITLGDIDNDGDIDIFLANYLNKELEQGQTIFEDDTYGATSALLLNNGDNTFTNITKEAGLDYIHNTFQGILVDIDNDRSLDLVVAHDTGEVRTYRNNGDLTFELKTNPLSNRFAFPMGIAAGDYNNDGLIDFMFSNTGSTLPTFLAKGDIQDSSRFIGKWLLFRNDGNFKFTDVADTAQIADYEFSWGAVFADINNDSRQDLLVAENYVDLLPHKLFRAPGRVLLQKDDYTFAPAEKASGLVNPHFGITPLLSDFNLDGSLDMVWVNVNTPSLAYLNESPQKNWLKVHLPQNAETLGAKVSVETSEGTLTDWSITGEGLASDQTEYLHFGLDDSREVYGITIELVNGTTFTLNEIEINSIVHIAE